MNIVVVVAGAVAGATMIIFILKITNKFISI